MSYSPWQSRVRLSNLPPTLMPAHIQHILTHPPNLGGKQRVSSGVNMIQIYTVPREQKRRKRTGKKGITLWSRLSSLSLSSGKSSPSSLSTPSPASSASVAASSVSVPSTSASSIASHDGQDGPDEDEDEDGRPGRRATELSRTSLTHTRVTEVPQSPSRSHARHIPLLDAPLAEAVEEEEGEEQVNETIAYITFTDEIHLWRAVAIFSHVTIDGLTPRVTMLRWTSAPLIRLRRRIFCSATGKSRYDHLTRAAIEHL